MDSYKTCDTKVCENISETSFFDNDLREVNMIHVNIRSIYQNVDQFLVFLETCGKKFDVIVTSESHNVYDTESFNIPGFLKMFNNSTLNTRRCDGFII